MVNLLVWVRARAEDAAAAIWALEYRITEWRMRWEAK